MSEYYNPKRTRNLYNPESSELFKPCQPMNLPFTIVVITKRKLEFV